MCQLHILVCTNLHIYMDGCHESVCSPGECVVRVSVCDCGLLLAVFQVEFTDFPPASLLSLDKTFVLFWGAYHAVSLFRFPCKESWSPSQQRISKGVVLAFFPVLQTGKMHNRKDCSFKMQTTTGKIALSRCKPPHPS